MPVFARGGKGQSWYVGYGVADKGYAVFLFSRHYWRILADFFIGFKNGLSPNQAEALYFSF